MNHPRPTWAVVVAICLYGSACSPEASSGSGGATGSGGSVQGSGGAGSGGSGSGGSTAGSGGDSGGGSGGQIVAGTGGTAPGTGGAVSDGGGGDVPVVSGGNTCEGVVTKFCDDFEKQTSGQAPTGAFKVSGAAGAAVVDETKPHGGTKSLHIKGSGSAGAELQFTTQFPFNDQHGRLMFFMSKVPTNSSHWDIVHSRNQTTDWEIGGQIGVFELVCDPPDHGLNSKTKFPEGKWFCLQWQFKFGGVGMDNTFLAAVDGVPVEKGMFTGPAPNGERWVASPWRNLNVGWTGYQASNVPIELWIDDLAFGEQPIPCPAP